MKIQILSDLHHEFGIANIQFTSIDMLIIAGDLNIGIKGINWLKENISGIPVIYVLGNHEYYKGNYPKTLYKIKDCAVDTNIHVLENESFIFNNITFHGCTLWTDFELHGNAAFYGSMCQQKMNDYKMIKLGASYNKLRSVDIYKIHKQSLRWLEDSLKNTTTEKNIVITHHAPSLKSVPSDFRENPLSAAYASKLDDFILLYQPDYWIHGHIHTPVEYKTGETKIICNPHGYINEEYNGFNNNLTIEI